MSTMSGVLLLAIALAAPAARAAEGAPAWRFGAAVGYGRQDTPPLGNRSYAHAVRVLKLVAARPLAARGALSLELQLEPFAAVARHRLLDAGFVRPGRGADAARARFTRDRSILELGMDVGLVARWAPTPRLVFLAMGSVGPMYADRATERLAGGFAFSDTVALGVGYRQGGFMVELRPTLRHVSNGGLQRPNAGHNTMLLVVAVSAAPPG